MLVQVDADLDVLAELISAGTVKPLLDQTYPLGEARQAFRYLEEEHARGKVVLAMAVGGARGSKET